MAQSELSCGSRATSFQVCICIGLPVVVSVTEVCSKLIAMRSVRHAPRPELAGVCAVHGTPMHALSAVSNPRADCFSGERSAATFYLAL